MMEGLSRGAVTMEGLSRWRGCRDGGAVTMEGLSQWRGCRDGGAVAMEGLSRWRGCHNGGAAGSNEWECGAQSVWQTPMVCVQSAFSREMLICLHSLFVMEGLKHLVGWNVVQTLRRTPVSCNAQ